MHVTSAILQRQVAENSTFIMMNSEDTVLCIASLRKQMLNSVKLQQQLLLYLRHSSQCVYPNCTVIRHCSYMKSVWKHIATCVDEDCPVTHCSLSKKILHHHFSCVSSSRCSICRPVLEAIRVNKGSKNVVSCIHWIPSYDTIRQRWQSRNLWVYEYDFLLTSNWQSAVLPYYCFISHTMVYRLKVCCHDSIAM